MKSTNFQSHANSPTAPLGRRVGLTLAPGLLAFGLIAAPFAPIERADAQVIDARPPEQPETRPEHLSIQLEIQRAIDRGLNWLAEQQDQETGTWGDPQHPALTALPMQAFLRDPSREPGEVPDPVLKAQGYLVDSVQTDGGIYTRGLATYNTAVALRALVELDNVDLHPMMLNARRFLINQQADFDLKGVTDNPLDGGIGYGGTYAHSDLSNTHLALEALHHAENYFAEREIDISSDIDLDWDAAITFVSRTQNLPDSNDQDWVSTDERDRGGFIYFPGKSYVQEDGEGPPRSYGSMTYAGLLSFIYADLDADDERVAAAIDWLNRHYTVEENPFMGEQGLYYYYHTMAKGLTAAGVKELALEDGTKADWRLDLAMRLFDTQQPDGTWVNETGRWWENDPMLVTTYVVLTLAYIHEAL